MENNKEVMSILTDISNYRKMLDLLNSVSNAPSFKIDIKKQMNNALNELERRLKYYEVEAK